MMNGREDKVPDYVERLFPATQQAQHLLEVKARSSGSLPSKRNVANSGSRILPLSRLPPTGVRCAVKAPGGSLNGHHAAKSGTSSAGGSAATSGVSCERRVVNQSNHPGNKWFASAVAPASEGSCSSIQGGGGGGRRGGIERTGTAHAEQIIHEKRGVIMTDEGEDDDDCVTSFNQSAAKHSLVEMANMDGHCVLSRASLSTHELPWATQNQKEALNELPVVGDADESPPSGSGSGFGSGSGLTTGDTNRERQVDHDGESVARDGNNTCVRRLEYEEEGILACSVQERSFETEAQEVLRTSLTSQDRAHMPIETAGCTAGVVEPFRPLEKSISQDGRGDSLRNSDPASDEESSSGSTGLNDVVQPFTLKSHACVEDQGEPPSLECKRLRPDYVQDNLEGNVEGRDLVSLGEAARAQKPITFELASALQAGNFKSAMAMMEDARKEAVSSDRMSPQEVLVADESMKALAREVYMKVYNVNPPGKGPVSLTISMKVPGVIRVIVCFIVCFIVLTQIPDETVYPTPT